MNQGLNKWKIIAAQNDPFFFFFFFYLSFLYVWWSIFSHFIFRFEQCPRNLTPPAVLLLHWPCDCESTPETRCYLYLLFSLSNETSPSQLQLHLQKTILLTVYFMGLLLYSMMHYMSLSLILTALCMIVMLLAAIHHVCRWWRSLMETSDIDLYL